MLRQTLVTVSDTQVVRLDPVTSTGE
jgi:hypothetical protein